MSDIISDIDGIPRRTAVDRNVNQHGHTLIDFLIDSKVCVLNGRFDSNTDNSTSVSIRGRSVVDFVCVPHDCFNSCENFEVISLHQLSTTITYSPCLENEVVYLIITFKIYL